MRKWLALVAIASATATGTVSMTGCTQAQNESSPAPAVQGLIQAQSKGDEYLVRLTKSGLGQTYLLQAGLIMQEQIPQFNGGRSRLVTFLEQGDRVYMLETSDGNLVSKSLDQSLLLASFPILKRETDAVLIDWAEGMSRIFTASDWTGQDFAGPDFKSEYGTVKVTNSLIEEAVQYQKNTAIFTQTAQAEVSSVFTGDTQVAVKVKYFLKPYEKNQNFQATVSRDFKTFGFFEVAPKIKENGFTVSYATKFDLSNGPIKFAVSADTPDAYKQAVRDGVLYWNSVIPGMVDVVDAPVGIQAPDLNYNVVQWVNWDAAGFAYADAMMDPLTGEIKHAQVYMTSVFAVGGRARAIRTLRKIRSMESQKHVAIGLKGLTGKGLCSTDYTSRFANSLEKAIEFGADDATIYRISADYVREVVAHEIGHTLGLRHNFAGNLGTSYKYTDRADLFKTYISDDKVDPSVTPASSVMEYSEFEEGVLIGAKMRMGHAPLSYDKAAILNLYQGVQPAHALDVAPFCTDTGADVEKYLDCTRFDSGRTLFEAAQTQSKELIDGISKSVIELFIRPSKEVLDAEQAVPLKSVGLDPAPMVEAYNMSRAKVLTALSTGRFWEVRREFPVIDSLNDEEVKQAERDFTYKNLQSLGGIAAVYQNLPADWEDAQIADLKSKLKSPQYISGLNANGVAWTLTADEIAWIEVRGEKYIRKLAEMIRENDIQSLNGLYQIPESDYQDELVSFLADWSVEYLLSVQPEESTSLTVKNKDGKDVNVKLAKFAYSQKLRKAATTLLSATRFKGEDAVKAEKKALKERFAKLLDECVGPRDQYESDKLPQEMKKWLKEQTEIESAL